RRAPVRVAAGGGRVDRDAGPRDHGVGVAPRRAGGRGREDGARLVAGVTRRFLLAGLTGGLATGKSTVSDMLRALGCVVLDADTLAREVGEPGQPALAAVAREFGPEVLGADGRLDRKRLGALVFADPDRRRRLEALTHPAIRERYLARLAELEAEGFEGIVVWDAPVMIEAGGDRHVERPVVGVSRQAAPRPRAPRRRPAPARAGRRHAPR